MKLRGNKVHKFGICEEVSYLAVRLALPNLRMYVAILAEASKIPPIRSASAAATLTSVSRTSTSELGGEKGVLLSAGVRPSVRLPIHQDENPRVVYGKYV